jgi:hypothetical protein
MQTFFQAKTQPIVLGFVMVAIAHVIVWLHLQGMVTPSMSQAAAAFVISTALPALIHFFDHHYNNGSPTNPANAEDAG